MIKLCKNMTILYIVTKSSSNIFFRIIGITKINKINFKFDLYKIRFLERML